MFCAGAKKLSVQSTFVLRIPQGTIMKIRSMQTCIMSSLSRCIFRCSVFRYVTLDNFFKLCYLIVISFTLVANKYLLTYLSEFENYKSGGGLFLSLVTLSKSLY